MYVNQILGQGQPHGYFYTNPYVFLSCTCYLLHTCIDLSQAAYQTYVEVWIERYIDEPTLFGWGLGMNVLRSLSLSDTFV